MMATRLEGAPGKVGNQMKHTRTAKLAFLFLAALVVLLGACKPARKTIDASGGDSTGRPPIGAQAGQEFAIALDSNITTGYSWSVDLGTLDQKVVVPLGSEYKEPAKGKVGQGGTQILSFKAVAPGTTAITLLYIRPFEKDAQPADTRTFTVNVR